MPSGKYGLFSSGSELFTLAYDTFIAGFCLIEKLSRQFADSSDGLVTALILKVESF